MTRRMLRHEIAVLCVLSACGSEASPEPSDDRMCADVNRAIAEETRTLRACTTASECGKPLPTLGSCGCTLDKLGRLDADTAALQALFTERRDLSHVEACQVADGPCVCPVVAGIACEEGECTWIHPGEDDPCRLLEGTFTSNEELECGLGEDEQVVLCPWTFMASDGEYMWNQSDFTLLGRYTCRDGTLSVEAGGGPYAGTIDDAGRLTLDGVDYTRTGD